MIGTHRLTATTTPAARAATGRAAVRTAGFWALLHELGCARDGEVRLELLDRLVRAEPVLTLAPQHAELRDDGGCEGVQRPLVLSGESLREDLLQRPGALAQGRGVRRQGVEVVECVERVGFGLAVGVSTGFVCGAVLFEVRQAGARAQGGGKVEVEQLVEHAPLLAASHERRRETLAQTLAIVEPESGDDAPRVDDVARADDDAVAPQRVRQRHESTLQHARRRDARAGG